MASATIVVIQGQWGKLRGELCFAGCPMLAQLDKLEMGDWDLRAFGVVIMNMWARTL